MRGQGGGLHFLPCVTNVTPNGRHVHTAHRVQVNEDAKRRFFFLPWNVFDSSDACLYTAKIMLKIINFGNKTHDVDTGDAGEPKLEIITTSTKTGHNGTGELQLDHHLAFALAGCCA